ncbi:hypothetical protein [Pontibacter oryzae]|uniref:MORN repeat variant n=1 Tax=Pontibacter oryzae TaxID=2304593 RepID=A0A399SGK4_9BACT|nr:hypothetical protein [Pontibacter oryzae]RIJ42338.1 hypothetical protein D1627_00230 [Pontibacter oryzae]
MKKLLLFVSLLYTFQSNAQNIKKILTASELDSVQQGIVLYKGVEKKTAMDFGGFEGEIAVRKINSKISYHFIGTANKYNSKRELIESMEMDSLGYLQAYYQILPEDGAIFDCVYEYKRINGTLYRLESQKLYYEPDRLWQEGFRYRKMTDGFADKFTSPNKRCGNWTFYTRNGEVEKTEDYGDPK